MTKRQRAKVVELLRCACDQLQVNGHDRLHYATLVDAGMALGIEPSGSIARAYEEPIQRAAMKAAAVVTGEELACAWPIAWGCSKDMIRSGLEAALRVELGEWP